MGDKATPPAITGGFAVRSSMHEMEWPVLFLGLVIGFLSGAVWLLTTAFHACGEE